MSSSPAPTGVPDQFSYYGDDESDPGPYPIPPNAPIEGGPGSDGDRHVLVIDDTNCILYELFDAHPARTAGSRGPPARARCST